MKQQLLPRTAHVLRLLNRSDIADRRRRARMPVNIFEECIVNPLLLRLMMEGRMTKTTRNLGRRPVRRM